MILISPDEILKSLWMSLCGNSDALERVDLGGSDPVLPSSFRVGAAAQVSIAAAGLAAAEVHRARTGIAQRVTVDMFHAATEFKSENHLRVDGGVAPDLWDPLAGTYRCGDGRWVRVHTNFAHHRDAIIRILGCEDTREAATAAFGDWSAEIFEDRAAANGAIAAMMRTQDEWDVHPQGQAAAELPVITIERIGDAAPQGLPPGERPLTGVRVLDLTRIIAGPIAGRTLAAHGAEVLLVTGKHLPAIAPLVIDTGRGKRSCEIDLRREEGRAALRTLLAKTDIFVQGYRPGTLSGRGFSPELAAQLRPGVVYVSLSAYGHTGPWSERRGFDSIVQTASGFNAEEAHVAGVDGPRALPCQALDHASGYLMAFGALIALQRRMTEGGSWHVRVALARTGGWLRDLGRVDDGLVCEPPAPAETVRFLETVDSGFGRLTSVRHAARLSETPAVWSRPSVPLGTHSPVWLS